MTMRIIKSFLLLFSCCSWIVIIVAAKEEQEDRSTQQQYKIKVKKLKEQRAYYNNNDQVAQESEYPALTLPAGPAPAPSPHQYIPYGQRLGKSYTSYYTDGRQIGGGSSSSSFNVASLQAPSSSGSNDYGVLDGGVDDNAVAGGGWGWIGGGISHGYGESDSKSPVNSSAVGLLGFLTVLALIQNVLKQMGLAGGGGGAGASTQSTTNQGALPGGGGGGGGGIGRRKRQTLPTDEEEAVADADPFDQMFPSPHSKGNFRCILKPYCEATALLRHNFAALGPQIMRELRGLMIHRLGNAKQLISELKFAEKIGKKKGGDCGEFFKSCKFSQNFLRNDFLDL